MKARTKFNLITLILLVIFMLPVSPYGNKGYYNFASNTLYCHNAYSCRHEIGHSMDAALDHPGRSYEFSHAIQLYLYVELHHETVSDFAMAILTYPPMMSHRVVRFPVSSSGQEELYADMYAWVDGDIDQLPEIFQEFYTNDASYRALYQCLMASELNICDRAVSAIK